MANVKDLKKKIKSTKSTLKITSAMKLVSAAKLSRAQGLITNSRPYSLELNQTIKTVSVLAENYSHPFLESGKSPHEVLLVVSSDKGLCGGYNQQLAKACRQFIRKADNPKVFFLGKKVKELIKKEVNFGKFFEPESNEPRFHDIKKVSNELADLFKSGEVGKIYVAYNKFNSAISFTPTIDQVLPIALKDEEREQLEKDFPFDFKYDPSAREILDTLIPEVFISTVYTCLLDAQASEHGSRMAAMDSAVKNCKEMIRSLTIKMNKLRQASITTELIEVISGAESLNG